MSHTLSDWDVRYSGSPNVDSAPAEVLRELLPLLPPGAALDLACGIGRNALFLAEQGWHVTAVDGSAAALEKLRENALRRGISIQEAQGWEDRQGGEVRAITLLQADLEAATLPASRFSLVLNVNYLQRSLPRRIEHSLLPGGVVLFETYTTNQLAFDGGPRNPEFLLTPGELRAAFPGCETLFYRELKAQRGIATLLARKSANPPRGAAGRA